CVGAHVGTALPLGHAHAKRDGRLFSDRCDAWIVGTAYDLRHKVPRNAGSVAQRGNRCVSHGNGAAMPGFHLRSHVASGATRHMRTELSSRPREKMLPSRAMQALRRADRHELMVSRVKLDMIDAVPPRIEAFELR